MKKWSRLGVVLALGASGRAADWHARYPKPEGYVSDFARVIDAAGKQRIASYAAGVEQATGVHMAFVTIPSLEGEPVDDVAGELFRSWSKNDKGDDNGILVLLSTAEHRFHLSEGAAVARMLPESLSGDVLSEMRPAVRNGDEGDALAAAATAIGEAIGRAKHVHFAVRPPARRHLPAISDRLNWMLAAGVLVLVWLFSRAPGPRANAGALGVLPWLVLGRREGRASYGSRGNGGFGGFDSGDGFGGFGGADSGAGGTSSDW